MFGKIIYCPKCQSEDVEIEYPPKERVSIDDYVQQESIGGVWQLNQSERDDRTVKCKACGYSKTIRKPRITPFYAASGYAEVVSAPLEWPATTLTTWPPMNDDPPPPNRTSPATLRLVDRS